MILSVTYNDGTKELIAGRMISTYPELIVVHPYNYLAPSIRINVADLKYGATTHEAGIMDYRHGGEVLRPER